MGIDAVGGPDAAAGTVRDPATSRSSPPRCGGSWPTHGSLAGLDAAEAFHLITDL